MPVIPINTGTVNPDGGVQALANFSPATAALDGVRGHAPGPLIGQDGTYFLAADATWKQGIGVSLIPVLRFTGSSTAGTGQSFVSQYFDGSYYTLAQDIQLFISDPAQTNIVPVRLFGNTSGGDFTLSTAMSSITVSYNLPANAILFIDSKVITSTAAQTYYILYENNDRVLTEDDANLIRRETNV